MYKILLFIPMYNCERQIIRVLEKIDNEILNYVSRVLVVNNRSTDNGENEVINYCEKRTELPLTLLRNKENYGAGGSHKIAFNYAVKNKFDYVIVLHGDDQGNIKDIISYLKSGEAYKYDAFLGSRFDKKSELINYSRFRIFGNRIFNLFMSIILGKKITDLGAGLNMYKVDYLASRFYMTFIDSLTFYVYMLIYIVFSKADYKFFPLTWREDDQISNAKFVKQSYEIVKVAFNYLINQSSIFKQRENDALSLSYDSEVIYDKYSKR